MQHTENKYKFLLLNNIIETKSQLNYILSIGDIKKFFENKKMVYHEDIFDDNPILHADYFKMLSMLHDNKEVRINELVFPFSFVNRRFFYVNCLEYKTYVEKRFNARMIKDTYIIDHVNRKYRLLPKVYLYMHFYIYYI